MPQLKLNQQIALLPATVPEFILDFLDGLESEDPLARESVGASMSNECLVQNREKIQEGFKKIRSDLGGKFLGIQVESYGSEVPNGYWCKITGETLTRGIGFLMKSRTGNIIKIEILDSDFNEDELKKRLA